MQSESATSELCRPRCQSSTEEDFGDELALFPEIGIAGGKFEFAPDLIMSRPRPPFLDLKPGQQRRPQNAESDGLPQEAVPKRGQHCQELVPRHHAHHAVLRQW